MITICSIISCNLSIALHIHISGECKALLEQQGDFKIARRGLVAMKVSKRGLVGMVAMRTSRHGLIAKKIDKLRVYL